jgi:predicted signal transduction protein with EAL and GGDEF domain
VPELVKMLPIDRLKIDRAFVRDVSRDPNDAAIVEAIIDMAHKLDLGICRRSVESTAQEEFLRARGCDAAQGYLYACPMPPGASEARSGRRRSATVVAALATAPLNARTSSRRWRGWAVASSAARTRADLSFLLMVVLSS